MFENLYRGSCIGFPFFIFFFDLCEVSQCDIIMKNQKFTDLDMDPHMNVIIRFIIDALYSKWILVDYRSFNNATIQIRKPPIGRK